MVKHWLAFLSCLLLAACVIFGLHQLDIGIRPPPACPSAVPGPPVPSAALRCPGSCDDQLARCKALDGMSYVNYSHGKFGLRCSVDVDVDMSRGGSP